MAGITETRSCVAIAEPSQINVERVGDDLQTGLVAIRECHTEPWPGNRLLAMTPAVAQSLIDQLTRVLRGYPYGGTEGVDTNRPVVEPYGPAATE